MKDGLLAKARNTSGSAFVLLDTRGQEEMLQSLLTAGASKYLTHGKAQPDFQRVISLGEPCFQTLSATAQTIVQAALIFAGRTYVEQDSGPDQLAAALRLYRRSIVLVEQRFESLNAGAQSLYLHLIGNLPQPSPSGCVKRACGSPNRTFEPWFFSAIRRIGPEMSAELCPAAVG